MLGKSWGQISVLTPSPQLMRSASSRTHPSGVPLPQGFTDCQAKNRRAPRGIRRVKSCQGAGPLVWLGSQERITRSELWEAEEVVVPAAEDAWANE